MRCGRWLTVLVIVVVLLMAGGLRELFSHRPSHFSGHGEGVGIIRLEGDILDTHDTLDAIHRATHDERVRAVVLRVNSPGGSVGASQELYLALKALRAKKPLVASFGTVAASGGYYAGMAAAPIFALPGTLTASIGVRMMHVDASALIQKLLLNPQTLKSGAMKDIGDPIRPMTPEERQFLETRLQAMHQQFIRDVAAARGRPEAEIATVADGRVLTGDEAIAAQLVDRIGTVYDAVAEAGRQAYLGENPDVLEYEPEGSVLDRFEWFGAKIVQRAAQSLRTTLDAPALPAAMMGDLQ